MQFSAPSRPLTQKLLHLPLPGRGYPHQRLDSSSGMSPVFSRKPSLIMIRCMSFSATSLVPMSAGFPIPTVVTDWSTLRLRYCCNHSGPVSRWKMLLLGVGARCERIGRMIRMHHVLLFALAITIPVVLASCMHYCWSGCALLQLGTQQSSLAQSPNVPQFFANVDICVACANTSLIWVFAFCHSFETF